MNVNHLGFDSFSRAYVQQSWCFCFHNLHRFVCNELYYREKHVFFGQFLTEWWVLYRKMLFLPSASHITYEWLAEGEQDKLLSTFVKVVKEKKSKSQGRRVRRARVRNILHGTLESWLVEEKGMEAGEGQFFHWFEKSQRGLFEACVRCSIRLSSKNAENGAVWHHLTRIFSLSAHFNPVYNRGLCV